jgi:hypothetical protein
MWELHCSRALDAFVSRMKALHYLGEVRHVRLSVFEFERDWKLDLSAFPGLRTVTFAPWQKDWTIIMGSEELSDEKVLAKLWNVMRCKNGYEPVIRAFHGEGRRYGMFSVFPIRFHLPTEEGQEDGSMASEPRWQLCVWRANLDTGVVERDWREVHLVQEATLD